MSYEKYTELLSAIISGKANNVQRAQVAAFEEEQPEKCPQCGAKMRSQFEPCRIVHDIANCPRLKKSDARLKFGDD